VRLVLLGSTRNEDDEELVRSLQAEAATLDITDHVEFVINAPYSDLERWLSRAKVGLQISVAPTQEDQSWTSSRLQGKNSQVNF